MMTNEDVEIAETARAEVEIKQVEEWKRPCAGGLPEPPAKKSQVATGAPDAPYSAFDRSQKRLIVFLIAFAAFFSPLSSFIYYPATTALARDLHVTVELINLSITSYLVVSGIAPAIIGDIADKTGRRLVYLGTLSVYLAANIGLALQKKYAGLLVLRMVQSVGSSASISLAYGVVADIADPSERGSYVGAVLCGPNVAPSLGPIIGGVLAQTASWRWIFWLLSILAGCCLAAMFLFLPETARTIVGNGSCIVASNQQGQKRPKIFMFFHQLPSIASPTVAANEHGKTQRKCYIPNPLPSLKILFHRNAALIILVNGSYYMTYACVQASMSSIFIRLYGFTQLQAGLIYIPFGVGCAIASYVSGRIMDRDYRIIARSRGFEDAARHDMANFPIEKARFRSVWYMVVLSFATIAGYGWSLHSKTSVAVPLVLQFIIGGVITVIFNMCGTLLVDLHPDSPASAQAALNIVRCSLSAGGLAVVEILINRIGVGWCFTLFAVICLSMVLPLWAEFTFGLAWRKAKAGEREAIERK